MSALLPSETEMKGFVLAVDLDGVVSDFIRDIRPHMAEWLNVPLKSLSEYPDYNLTQWGINEAPGGYPGFNKFAVEQRGLFINSRPIFGAPQALRQLSDLGIHIRIVTARLCISGSHAEIIKQTVDWLEKYGIPYWDICFMRDKCSVTADLYIDDSTSNIHKLQSMGKTALIYCN